jgi:3-hydroxyisobutyrate dehydrogenase
MTVLFIGLGAMGLPMARNLGRVRPDLIVFDADPRALETASSAGLTASSGLDSLPSDLDTTVLMLPSTAIVERVLYGDGGASPGLLDRLPRGGVVIDMGSSEPLSTARIAADAAAKGLRFVDAPVSGGVAKAITAELAIMAGGTADDVARVRPLLDALGGHVVHVGPSGAGHAAKALNNLLSATNIAAAAEVLSAAARFGIRPETMLDVVNASTGRSQASEVKYPAEVLTGRFASGFRMDLMLKDLAIARSLTSGGGLDTPVTDAAFRVATDARPLAGEHPDHTELVRYYEDRNGVSLRAASAAAQDGQDDDRTETTR